MLNNIVMVVDLIVSLIGFGFYSFKPCRRAMYVLLMGDGVVTRMLLLSIWVESIGLLGQALRNYDYIMTGISPKDSDFPIWMAKDLGYAMIVMTLCFWVYRHKEIFWRSKQ